MLPNSQHLILFLTATIILNLTPGSDILYVASQSLYNLKQGIFAVLGVSTGIAVYIIATSLGLTTIIQHSPLVFNLIKFIGAFYLLYLALQLLFQTDSSVVIRTDHKTHQWQSYKKGFFTNLLNPKVGIFFLTFLPQFVDIDRGHVGIQLFTLGLFFIVSGTIINLMYALLFFNLKEKIFSNLSIRKWLNKCTAIIFCLLAIKVLTAHQN